VSKLHYWTYLEGLDDAETSLSTVAPLVTLSSATRSIHDTFTRAVVWTYLVASVSGTTPPAWQWLQGATVDWLFFFDTESDGHAVNITDNDPYTLGFSRCNLTVQPNSTANRYNACWQGPVQGINLEGQRKGYSAVNLPAFSAQRWVSDNNGVFDNFAHFGVTFSSRVVGRVLWSTDVPPAP